MLHVDVPLPTLPDLSALFASKDVPAPEAMEAAAGAAEQGLQTLHEAVDAGDVAYRMLLQNPSADGLDQLARDLPLAIAELAPAEELIERALTKLATDWSVARARALDASVGRRDAAVDRIRRAGEGKLDELRRFRAVLVRAERDVQRRQAELAAHTDADEALLARITTSPEIFGGKPIIRGRRLAVEHVLAMLAAGDSIETILEGYRWLERDDVLACLTYARRVVGHERIEAPLKTGT